MTPPLQLLTYRLAQRGVLPDHIPGLMRNLLRFIGDGGMFTTTLVNAQLEQLGWGCEVLDESCFQLIVYILESEWGYRIRHYHSNSMEIITKTNWKSLSS